MKIVDVTPDYIHFVNDDGESEFHPHLEPHIEVDHELRRKVAWSVLIFNVLFYGAILYFIFKG